MTTSETFERVLDEILNFQDVYVEAPGPEGPWNYRSFIIYRRMNELVIYDVDGEHLTTISMEAISEADNPKHVLEVGLDYMHYRSMREL